MKKILLLLFIFTAITIQAQDYWTEFSTSQPLANTGVGSISIVDDQVTWLHMRCGTLGCTPMRRYSKTNDSGITWQTAEIDLGSESNQLRIANISGTSDTTAFVAVYPDAPDVVGGIWKTVDGGTTWIRQNTAEFSDPASLPSMVHFWDTENGVCIGDPVDGYFEIYTTDNGGNTWTRVPSSYALIPLQPEEYLFTNNYTVTGNTIWALTTSGRLLKSADRGLTWSNCQTPITEFYFDPGFIVTVDMAFTDENNGLLQTNTLRLFSTTDGGLTWEEMTSNTNGYRTFAIAAIPGLPHTYISVGEDNTWPPEKGSSFTVDDGLNWTNINNNPDLNYVNGGVIEMRSILTGFAGGWSVSPVVGGIFKWVGTGCNCSTTGFSGGKCMVLNPNPSLGIYNIISENISQIMVLDASGKQIMSNLYPQVNQVDLNMNDFANGLYLIRVINDKGTMVSRIIKQ